MALRARRSRMENVRRARRRAAGLALVVGLAVAAAGCQEEGETVSEQNSENPSVPAPTRPSAPPSGPTDSFAKVRVVGTVVAAGENGCVDVKDANGVLWSLVGPGTEGLAEGDQVSATGQALPESGACAGAAVRVQKVTRQN